jgi:hypothetical protein
VDTEEMKVEVRVEVRGKVRVAVKRRKSGERAEEERGSRSGDAEEMRVEVRAR